MLQAVYPDLRTEPALTAPESETKRTWERSDAIRELVRGRIEIIGPITNASLAQFFHLTESEIEQALLFRIGRDPAQRIRRRRVQQHAGARCDGGFESSEIDGVALPGAVLELPR